jgi:hypothetical protein
VGPRAGLDTEDRGNILLPVRGSNLDRPVAQPVARHYTRLTAVAATLTRFAALTASVARRSNYAELFTSCCSARWFAYRGKSFCKDLILIMHSVHYLID